ncbi:MAG: di-trans,poly-cis-decaprenylcistransferase [Deltaproteobacteria bacterium]|nr:di-trans,poly-cis-decaprenylcistransferase [Deltaproteobacteria bacterium]
MALVDVSRIPQHVAIIMDGNGRWAQARSKPRTAGHERGADAVRATMRAARRLGIPALTLYAFSEQNWDRPEAEINALVDLLCECLVSERNELLDNEIRLSAIGRLHKLPQHAQARLLSLSEETASCKGMTLTLALSYGGREELIDAARALASAARDGEIKPQEIDEAAIDRCLPSMNLGPVDLLIRTGGEQRISNFLLWGSAYAELYFTDQLWPDFGANSLYSAIRDYQGRERRFGLVPEVDAEGTAREARRELERVV